MIPDIPYPPKGVHLGTLQAEALFFVLLSVGVGAAAGAILPYGPFDSIVWAEAYGLATFAAWHSPWNARLIRYHRLAAMIFALVAGNLLGSLLGGFLHSGNPFWLTRLETEALLRHSLTYLGFFVPAVMLVCWNGKNGDLHAQAVEEERNRQEDRRKVAEAEHLLLTTSICPASFVKVLDEAAGLLSGDKTAEARILLEAAARHQREILSRFKDAIPVLPGLSGESPPPKPPVLSYQHLSFRALVFFELLILVISAVESLFLGMPFQEIALFVHMVGWSIVASCALVARLTGGALADAIPLLGGVPLGVIIGKGLLGSVFMGDPLFMVRDPEGIRILPFSLFFSAVGALLVWQHGKSLEARTAYARSAARRADSMRQLVNARICLLRAQIEPHFLFNTLSNIIAQSFRDKRVAKKMIHLLSRLVERSLSREGNGDGTLGDELDGIRTYLDLQGLRIGPRLTWTVDCPDELMSHPFPQLLIQPLVENSIRHGIEAVSGRHLIRVRVGAAARRLTIDITDTGCGIRSGYVNGVGLSNLRERLATHYGSGADLWFLPNDPAGLTARLAIPLMPA